MGGINMGNWSAKDRLIDKYSDAIYEKFIDSSSQDLGFIDEYLRDFADELEDLITEDIRDSIISKN